MKVELRSNRSTSCLVVEVKEKKDQDTILLRFNEIIHKQKVMVSPRGEMVGLNTRVNSMFQILMVFEFGLLLKLIVPSIPFILSLP